MGLGDFARRVFGAPPAPSAIQAPSDPYRALNLVAERQRIDTCLPRARCTVAGRIVTLDVSPDDRAAQLAAVIVDESGMQIRLVWLGRRALAGVEPGRIIGATGTVLKSRGELRIVDPSYTIIDGEAS